VWEQEAQSQELTFCPGLTTKHQGFTDTTRAMTSWSVVARPVPDRHYQSRSCVRVYERTCVHELLLGDIMHTPPGTGSVTVSTESSPSGPQSSEPPGSAAQARNPWVGRGGRALQMVRTLDPLQGPCPHSVCRRTAQRSRRWHEVSGH
jgi:hypothetical protein